MIRQQAGQVLVAGFVGQDAPVDLLRRAAAGELGGFIQFKRNVGPLPDVMALNRELIAAFPAHTPPWMIVDQEGGRVQRLGEPLLQLPPMRVLSQRDDLELTRTLARTQSHQLRALGFSLNTAPVLDVDTNPQNPVIGDRSFGSTTDRVIAQARAFAAGMAEAGLASCGKHFPGHGDTQLDSHLALPRVRHGRARLDEVEIAPFAALAARLPTLMTSHVVFDALDREQPATLSSRICTDLLRGVLGFDGPLFSDDMDMAAITAHHDAGAAAVAAVTAGCDQLLMCRDEERLSAAFEGLVKRAEADAGFAQRLSQAADRGLSARRRFAPQVAKLATDAEVIATFAAQSATLNAQLSV